MKKLLLFTILGLASSAYGQVSISGTSVQVGGTGTGCPTSGCTFTGPITGTNATFSGNLAVGTTSPTNAPAGTFASLYPTSADKFNVKAYGAKGDGTTDDTAAVNAAYTAACSVGLNGCADMVIPPGNYLISSTLNWTKAVHVYGVGVAWDGTGSIGNYNGPVLVKSASLNGPLMQLSGAGSTVEHLTLQGLSGNGGDGIQVLGYGIKLIDVAVGYMGGNGIRIGLDSGLAGGGANNFVLDRPNTLHNGGNGIYCNDNANGTTAGAANANVGRIISVNSQSNTGDGVTIGNCAGVRISGGSIESNTGYGIHEKFMGAGMNAPYLDVDNVDVNEANTAGNYQRDPGTFPGYWYGLHPTSASVEPTRPNVVTSITVNAGGSGYANGDSITVVQAGGAFATFTNTGTGACVVGTLTNSGYGYTAASGLATTTTGAGTGCTVNITVAPTTLGYFVSNITDRSGSKTGTQGTLFNATGNNYVDSTHSWAAFPGVYQIGGNTIFQNPSAGIFIGFEAGGTHSAGGYSSATGSANVSIGPYSLGSLTSGTSNTSVGYNSCAYITSGGSNVCVGGYSGLNSTGTNNVFVGYNAQPAAAADTNEVVVGGGAATGHGTNTVTLGNTSNTALYLGNTLIPTSQPSIRAGTWTITASTSVAVTFGTAMSVAPTSCAVNPSASSATTGQPYATTFATTGFTVNVPTSGTLSGTYQCVVNNTN